MDFAYTMYFNDSPDRKIQDQKQQQQNKSSSSSP